MRSRHPARPSRSSVSAAHARGQLDIPWRGMPGPVWTMAVGAALYALLAIVAVATRSSSSDSDGILLATAGYSLAVVGVLLVLRDRTPTWLLKAQVALVVLITGMLVAMAPTSLAVANLSFRYLAITVYVAYWMSRRMSIATSSLISVTSLAAYLTHDDGRSELTLTWLAVTALVWLLGILVGYLSRVAVRHATVDPLTGLLSRSALAAIIDLSQTPGRVMLPRALVIVDLDDFKALNDTRGHLAGDRALTELGEGWRRTLRADDIAVRSGGDEFLLILPQTSPEEARALIARLQAASPIPWSYGIADWAAGEEFDVAVAHADDELYRHKRGRSRTRPVQ